MTLLPELPPRISLRDVALRDGLQIEDPVPTAGKLRMLDALVASGLQRIEATAFVSPSAVPAMADAELVAEALNAYRGVEFSALVASVTGARRAIAAGISNVEYVVSAADGHSRANARATTSEAVGSVAEVSRIVHEAGGTCEVIIAVAWDCPFDGRTPVARTVDVASRAVDLGADRISLGDTIGTVTPERMAELAGRIWARLPDLSVGIHLHDTRGAGLATALAAMQIGITQFDASVGGLGGCPFAPGASGNIASEELVYLCAEMGVETGVDLDRLVRAAQVAREVVGHELPSRLLRAEESAVKGGSA